MTEKISLFLGFLNTVRMLMQVVHTGTVLSFLGLQIMQGFRPSSLLLENGADPTSLDAVHAAAFGGSSCGEGREQEYAETLRSPD